MFAEMWFYYRLHQITSQKSGEFHGFSGSSLIGEIVPFLEATSPSSPHRSSAGCAWAAEAAQRSKGSLPRCTRRKEPRSTCGQAMFGTHLFMYKSNLYLYNVYIYITIWLIYLPNKTCFSCPCWFQSSISPVYKEAHNDAAFYGERWVKLQNYGM